MALRRLERISKGSPRTWAAFEHQRWSKPVALIERISGEKRLVSEARCGDHDVALVELHAVVRVAHVLRRRDEGVQVVLQRVYHMP